jgi:uncharacterized iron-regulated membrane protein
MRRASFLTIHRWLALMFAPLLLVQALTGVLLLFRAELAPMIDPHGLVRHSASGTVPVSSLIARAQARDPGVRIARLFLPTTTRDVAFAQMADGSFNALDPGDGSILRSGGFVAFPFELVQQVHYHLVYGPTGLAIVAANGAVLALLAATGLGFWWPGRGRIARSLKLNGRMPGRLLLRHWHRSGGVALSILLLMSAVTGLCLSVPDLLPSGSVAAPSLSPRTAAQIDAAVAAAQARFPSSPVRDIRFPAADELAINLFAPRRNARAVDMVQVRVSDAAVLRAIPTQDNPVLWMKVLYLHTGDVGGLVGRWVVLVEAMVLAALSVTGPVMWWQARRLRK